MSLTFLPIVSDSVIIIIIDITTKQEDLQKLEVLCIFN